jgi:hypothetical protein
MYRVEGKNSWILKDSEEPLDHHEGICTKHPRRTAGSPGMNKYKVAAKNSWIARMNKCSLSLWRVVRGSKLMHLDLIHGLFIT